MQRTISLRMLWLWWGLSCLFVIICMHLRHLRDFAYFPESISEYLIYILIVVVQSLAFAGLSTLIVALLSRLFKVTKDKILKFVIPMTVFYFCSENFFLLRVESIMGKTFNFFQFAEDVGGVSNMLSDAWAWYASDIVLVSLSVIFSTIAAFIGYNIYLKKKKKESRLIPIQNVVLIFLLSQGFSLWLMGPYSFAQPSIQHELRTHSMCSALNYALSHLGYREKEKIPSGEEWLDVQTKAFIKSYSQPLNTSFVSRRNVFIILLESTRYDMLDYKLDDKVVMPELNKWINEGALRIDGAYSTRGFTFPSVTQTFWGGYVYMKQSMIHDFKLLGYRTAVFSSDNMKDSGALITTGCDKAADYVLDGIAPSNIVAEDFEKYMASYDSSEPLFAYLFFQDPHFPFQTENANIFTDRPIKLEEVVPKHYSRVWRSYVNQVHHADISIGRIYQVLKQKQMLDNSLVIIISDHGEIVYDNGYSVGHGDGANEVETHSIMAVYGSKIDVPGMFSHPDIRSFIYANLSTPDSGQTAVVKNVQFPVFQLHGDLLMPEIISFRYPDGRRIGYQIQTRKAWIESDLASYTGEKVYKKLPSSEKMPIDYEVNVPEDLIESDLRRAPLSVNTPEVQNLIHYWQYLRHTQLQVSHEK